MVQGVGGIPVVGGRFPEDELPELRGTQAIHTYYTMLDTDPTISAAWDAVRQTLLSAEWSFAPGSASAFADKLAREANGAWGFGDAPGVMTQSWEEALDGGLLLWVLLGWVYGEVGWGFSEQTGRIEVMQPFLHRDGTAHYRWEYCSQTGEFLGVSQTFVYGENIPNGTRTHPFIPADNMVLLTRSPRGGALEAPGVLRACYTPWKHLRDLQIMQMRGAEANSVGIPVLSVDYERLETLNLSDSRKEQEINTVLRQLQDYVVGNSAVIMTPDWIKLEMFGRNGGTEYDFPKAIQQKEHQILRRFLMQTLDLGATATGSRAVATVHDSILRQSLINILQQVAAAYRPVMRRWAELNWPGVLSGDVPKLTFSGLDVSPILEVLDKVPALISSGALIADDPLRGQIRRDLRVAPEAPQEGTDDV